MSTTATSRAAATVLLSLVASAARSIVRVVVRYTESLGNRWMARDLADLNDRELADIGLVRDDLYQAFSVPFASDPTVALADAARQRPMTVAQPPRSTAREHALPPEARGRIA